MLKRTLILGGMSLIAFSNISYGESDPTKWPLVKEAFFAQRPMADAPFITFVAPRRAESGAQVPLEISIDQTQADEKAKSKKELASANPLLASLMGKTKSK